MSSTVKKPIHVSVDETLKKEAEQLFDDLGLNMTTAITIFLQQSVSSQSIPFEIKKENRRTERAITDVKSGKILGGFDTIYELMEDLDA